MSFLHIGENLGVNLEVVSDTSTIANPPSGFKVLFQQSDGFYTKDSSGTVAAFGAGDGELILGANDIFMSPISTPADPSSGNYKFYVKSDGNLYILNSSGTETQIGSGGGGTPKYFWSINTGVQAYNGDGSMSGFASGSGETALEFNNSADVVIKDVGSLTDGDAELKAVADGLYALSVSLSVYANTGAITGAVCSNLNLYNSDNSLDHTVQHHFWQTIPTTNAAEENWIYAGEFYLTNGQYMSVTITNDSGENIAVCFRSLTWRQIQAVTI